MTRYLISSRDAPAVFFITWVFVDDSGNIAKVVVPQYFAASYVAEQFLQGYHESAIATLDQLRDYLYTFDPMLEMKIEAETI